MDESKCVAWSARKPAGKRFRVLSGRVNACTDARAPVAYHTSCQITLTSCSHAEDVRACIAIHFVVNVYGHEHLLSGTKHAGQTGPHKTKQNPYPNGAEPTYRLYKPSWRARKNAPRSAWRPVSVARDGLPPSRQGLSGISQGRHKRGA
jgi:hypothetical protein